MEILYLLIPLSLVLVGIIVWIFLWAVRSGQFDDMEGPAHQILMDNDDPVIVKQEEDSGENTEDGSAKPESPSGSPTLRQNR
jgi:cbb3-type cytochrome oxidase maturation protein